MPDLNATIADPAANVYLSLSDADSMMDGFVAGPQWLNLDEATRQRLILDATRKIDRFKRWPPKQVVAPVEQALAFPTAKDLPLGSLPREVVNALLEQLNFEASGELKSLKKLQAEGVKSRSLLGQSSSFESDPSQLCAGARNELLSLWKTYNGPVVTQIQVRRMWQPETSGQSLFDDDQINGDNTGGLGPI